MQDRKWAPLARRRSSTLFLWVTLSLIFPQVVTATPLISELFYDAAGSDDAQVFVELSGTPGTLLDGMTLEGVNGAGGGVGPIVSLTGVIAADGLFVVADMASDGSTQVPLADLLANFDFQNGPDSVVLRSAAGSVLDSLGYGVFGAGDVFAGEGTAAIDPPAGSSLARFFADVDSDDNAIDFEVLASPTPGFATFASVPEPSTATLLMAGLSALAGVRRRRATALGA